MGAEFPDQFAALFETSFRRLFRFLDRLSGEPELAADLAQEAFVRLYRRGRLPDAPEAWLVTVGLNLFRNDRSTRSRRRRLMSAVRSEAAHSDPTPAPDRDALADESRRRVRSALEQLTARDRELLLLRAEGYSYRELALALDLHEASIGTLLVRARGAFRQAYGSPPDAS